MLATNPSSVDQAFPDPGVWEFDPGHSSVAFEARHLMVSKIRGRFETFNGRFHAGAGSDESFVELTVEAASVESGLQARDDHVRSADFLGAAAYPVITYRSTSIRHAGGDRWTAIGDLTIRGVTRRVETDVEFAGGVTDPWGNEKIGFSAVTIVDREEWGMTWNAALDAGGLVVSKKVRIEIDVEAVRTRP